MPEWKKELFKSIVNPNPSFSLFYNDLPCVNQLSLKTSPNEFGISLISEKNTKYVNLLINYYPEYLSELFSDCKNYENLMLKYSISIRKTNSIYKNDSENELSSFEKVSQYKRNT